MLGISPARFCLVFPGALDCGQPQDPNPTSICPTSWQEVVLVSKQSLLQVQKLYPVPQNGFQPQDPRLFHGTGIFSTSGKDAVFADTVLNPVSWAFRALFTTLGNFLERAHLRAKAGRVTSRHSIKPAEEGHSLTLYQLIIWLKLTFTLLRLDLYIKSLPLTMSFPGKGNKTTS